MSEQQYSGQMKKEEYDTSCLTDDGEHDRNETSDGIGNESLYAVSASDEKDVKTYECDECPKKFTIKGTFRSHKNIHTDKYKCLNCQKRFHGSRDLRNHNCERVLKRRRNEIETNVNNAEVAGSNQVTLEMSEQQYSDQIKKEDFDTSCLTNKDIPDVMTYECKECPKKFTHEGTFKTHKNIHTDKYKCSNCQKRFQGSRDLRVHNCARVLKQRNDSNVILGELFECKDCQKKFSKRSTLRTHQTIHTDKYKCSKCQQRFYTNQNLQNHICENLLNRRNPGNKEEILKYMASMFTEDVHNTVDEISLLASDIDANVETSNSGVSGSDDIDAEAALEDYELISCDICDKFFATKESLQKHIENTVCKTEQSES